MTYRHERLLRVRPGSVRYPCLLRCHAVGSAVALRVFPSHGPILRRIPSLLTGSRGAVRLFSSGTMNALRLPTALGSRFIRHFTFATRLAVGFAPPCATTGARQPGLVQPVDLSGNLFRETIGSPKFPGNPWTCSLIEPTHTYALFFDPGRTSRARPCARSVLFPFSQTPGTPTLSVIFEALSHGSVHAVYASCHRRR